MTKLLIAGSYERLLYGLQVTDKAIEPTFIYPAHISCITALASCSRYLATGSTDEQIKLYDLKLRKEIGNLMHHTGTITSLVFIGKQHLLTASADGIIGIVRTHDWEVLKKLKGHNGPIQSISPHRYSKWVSSF